MNIRGVFGAAGLAPILDRVVAGVPVRLLRYPLPADPSTVEELILDVLRTGYGLSENAKLELASWEGEVLEE